MILESCHLPSMCDVSTDTAIKLFSCLSIYFVYAGTHAPIMWILLLGPIYLSLVMCMCIVSVCGHVLLSAVVALGGQKHLIPSIGNWEPPVGAGN